MAKKFPEHPKHPERNCWECHKYCAAGSMSCGNGNVRTQHPVEVLGDDWLEWERGVAEEMVAVQVRRQDEVA
ncbi:DUF3079 domain-containing protein [Caballeronia sp. DA-9]|uniref:DUF3079 domain-containing protein n=1 Tax=Caballeronia sp. DA-9 TaxID=3436237 RepID=UPI003F67CF73